MSEFEDLGPLLVAPANYLEARSRIRSALGFPTERKPLLIGIDGANGAGKSSLGAWLSWQLEMPALNLDVYLLNDSEPLAFRVNELNNAIDSCSALSRPIIVEGILLLDVLGQLGRSPDFLVFVEKESDDTSEMLEVRGYLDRARPQDRANFILQWSSAEHDAAAWRAHERRNTERGA